MDQETPTPPLPATGNGPVIVCMDEGPGRSAPLLDQIADLVRRLGGSITGEEVGGATRVAMVRLPPAAALRFQSALALRGASFFGPPAEAANDFLVVLSSAPTGATSDQAASQKDDPQ